MVWQAKERPKASNELLKTVGVVEERGLLVMTQRNNTPTSRSDRPWRATAERLMLRCFIYAKRHENFYITIQD